MRVLHIATNDTLGGAARAARRQHSALKSCGIDSLMFVLSKSGNGDDVRAFDYSSSSLKRVLRRIRKHVYEFSRRKYLPNGRGREGIFSDGRVHLSSAPALQMGTPDVINCHWVADFISFDTLFQKIATEFPVVWTLHDMNPFTGGCHYSGFCDEYKRRCGTCPQVHESHPDDLSRKTWIYKDRMLKDLSGSRIKIVCPSNWLATSARESSLFSRLPVEVVPYCLDTRVFAPGETRDAREQLGITGDGCVVLFVASGVDSTRKGLDYVVRALIELEKSYRPTLLTLGRGKPQVPDDVKHIHLEGITDEKEVANVYRTADMLVAPSLEDNLPLTVQEGMASGLPVIAFNIGGMPDMVQSGENGYLVEKGDVSQLRDAIYRLASDQALRVGMGEESRKIAMDRFSEQANSNAYLKIYESLLSGQA